MSEQGLSGENSPAVAGPTEAPGAADENSQPNVDWQKRFVDTQEAYTRGQQEIADFRRQNELKDVLIFSEDPDQRRQAALELGVQLEEDDSPSEPTDYDDPYEQLSTRTERLEQQLAQRQQAETESQENALIGEASAEALTQFAGDLDERSQNFILSYAINALPAVVDPRRRLPNGQPLPVPDIKGAMEEFGLMETERQRNWAKTKRGAPYVPAGGLPANEVPDPGTGHEARMNRAMLSLRNNASDDA